MWEELQISLYLLEISGGDIDEYLEVQPKSEQLTDESSTHIFRTIAVKNSQNLALSNSMMRLIKSGQTLVFYLMRLDANDLKC
jgi:hypothetical protein